MGIYDRDYYGDERVNPLGGLRAQSMVTWLIGINVVLFIANFLFSSSTDALTRSLMLRSSTLWEFWNWWRFLTYGFVHANLGHILVNMLSLFFLGRAVEARLGKWEFLRFYLVTLVLCGVVWCLLHWREQAAVLGASGAVTAVSMLFVFYFPHATLLLWMVIPIKAWVLGILIVLLNVFTPSTADGSVAYDVHLVGAAVAAGYFFGKWNFYRLGTWFADLSNLVRSRRRGLKIFRETGTGGSPRASSKQESAKTAEDEEADRILDKIYREGEASLTRRERDFMERYSRKIRSRRQ